MISFLQPLILDGNDEAKSKMTSALMSNLYIYENIYLSNRNDTAQVAVFKHFIDSILPLSESVSSNYYKQLLEYKKLVNKKIEYKNYTRFDDSYDSKMKAQALKRKDFFRKEPLREELKHLLHTREPKILVLGESKISDNEIYGIAKKYGFKKNQIELHTDYDKITNFDISKYRRKENYDGIIIAPIPHSIKGINENTSIMRLIENEEAYPYVIKTYTEAGEFKMTKTSFERAMRAIIEVQKGNVSKQ